MISFGRSSRGSDDTPGGSVNPRKVPLGGARRRLGRVNPSSLRRAFDGLPGPAQDMARKLSRKTPREERVAPALRDPDRLPTRAVSSGDDEVWIERVREIAPLIDEHREEIERARAVTGPVAEAMRRAGFARIMVPTTVGGAGASLVAGTRVCEELGRLDGSVGWIAQVTSGHGRLADCMSAEAAEAVFDEGSGVLAGSVQPTGVAIPVDGGYRISGRWGFASGFSMADYLTAAAKVEGTPKGHPAQIAVLLRPDDVQLLDTWHTTGLLGTGSHDFVAEDLFVPQAFTFPANDVWRVLEGEGIEFGRPFGEYGPTLMAAVALGIAQRALEDFGELVARKAARPDPHWSAKLPLAFTALGRSTMALQSARLFLYENAHALAELGPGDPDLSLQSRAACRYVIETLLDTVDEIYEMAGSTAIYATSRIERCFRDIHMVSHHALVSMVAYGEAGEAVAALPSSPSSD
jgi:alkylation response protein AidB-like acyl-CoA dehydrogenase